MTCPPPEELARELGRMARGTSTGALDEHLAGCDACRRAMVLAAGDAALPRAGSGGSFTVGQVIGRYRVEALVGAGASSFVFRAKDLELDRPVALKWVARGELDGGERARLVHEAQTLARLAHANVATVYELVRSEQGWCLAMEWVEGERLGVFAQRVGRARERLMPVLTQVAEGLAAVHAQGLAHGDVKADNVLVRPDGVAKLVDFGLARGGGRGAALVVAEPVDELMATRPFDSGEGHSAGTPAYMSAELLEGHPSDARSDQFAFFVTLCEAFTGSRPYKGNNLDELRRSLAAGRPQALDQLEPSLRQVVRRGLAYSPEDRHPSMQVVAGLLARGKKRSLLPVVALGAALLLAAGGWALIERLAEKPLPADNPALRLRLAIVEGRLPFGQSQEIMTAAAQLRDDAMKVRAYATAGAAAIVLGRGQSRLYLYDESKRTLWWVLQLGEKANDDALRATALTQLIYIQLQIGNFADADQLSSLADAVLERLGYSNRRLRARLLRAQGVLLTRQEQYVAAEPKLREALALARQEWGETCEIAPYYLGVATWLQNALRMEEALVPGEQATRVCSTSPADVPQYVQGLLFLDAVYDLLGRYPLMAETAERARDLARQVMGPDHHDVFVAELHLAVAWRELGKTELAWELMRGLVARAAATLLPDDYLPTNIRVEASFMASEQGDLASAKKWAELAVSNPKAHPKVHALAEIALTLASGQPLSDSQREALRTFDGPYPLPRHTRLLAR